VNAWIDLIVRQGKSYFYPSQGKTHCARNITSEQTGQKALAEKWIVRSAVSYHVACFVIRF